MPRKLELKLPPPLKSVTVQLYSHMSENNLFNTSYLIFNLFYHELLFAHLFFSLMLTSLQYYCNILFVALLVPFSCEDRLA